MSKLTPRQRVALELIKAQPEAMAWPGRFAEAFWDKNFISPTTGGRLHAQRNHAGGRMAAWWAAGYLGRLRKSGLITGGDWERARYLHTYSRTPLRLTELAKDLLVKAQADEAAKRPQTVGHAAEERLQFGR